jgi:hypothetical protein
MHQRTESRNKRIRNGSTKAFLSPLHLCQSNVKIRRYDDGGHSFFLEALKLSLGGCIQRHTLGDRPPSTAACPACCALKALKKCKVRKKYFVLGRLEHLRQDKFSCTCTTSPTNQPRKDPFQSFLSPLSPQFQQPVGAIPLYSLSGCKRVYITEKPFLSSATLLFGEAG